MRSPEKARTLHVAIANILRSDGAQMPSVLQHLLAARVAAEATDEAETILIARLELADAYIEAGNLHFNGNLAFPDGVVSCLMDSEG